MVVEIGCMPVYPQGKGQEGEGKEGEESGEGSGEGRQELAAATGVNDDEQYEIVNYPSSSPLPTTSTSTDSSNTIEHQKSTTKQPKTTVTPKPKNILQSPHQANPPSKQPQPKPSS